MTRRRTAASRHSVKWRRDGIAGFAAHFKLGHGRSTLATHLIRTRGGRGDGQRAAGIRKRSRPRNRATGVQAHGRRVGGVGVRRRCWIQAHFKLGPIRTPGGRGDGRGAARSALCHPTQRPGIRRREHPRHVRAGRAEASR